MAKSWAVDVRDQPAAMAYWPKSVLDMDSESDPVERMHPTVRAPSSYLRKTLNSITHPSMTNVRLRTSRRVAVGRVIVFEYA